MNGSIPHRIKDLAWPVSILEPVVLGSARGDRLATHILNTFQPMATTVACPI
jgi:hypothetical protein